MLGYSQIISHAHYKVKRLLEPLIESIFALLSRPASYGPKGVVSRSIITLVGSAGFVIFRGLVRKAASQGSQLQGFSWVGEGVAGAAGGAP